MSISKADVRKVATLGRLGVAEDDLDHYQETLSSALSMIEYMNKFDDQLASLAPMAHAQDTTQRTRADTVTESNQRDSYQALAPDHEHGLYLVNKVIE